MYKIRKLNWKSGFVNMDFANDIVILTVEHPQTFSQPYQQQCHSQKIN